MIKMIGKASGYGDLAAAKFVKSYADAYIKWETRVQRACNQLVRYGQEYRECLTKVTRETKKAVLTASQMRDFRRQLAIRRKIVSDGQQKYLTMMGLQENVRQGMKCSTCNVVGQQKPNMFHVVGQHFNNLVLPFFRSHKSDDCY